ncbi:hypothetical protein HYX11_02510 [Candidatus Woesearchaeota archaeon]|nr:hypothetical protein [Candidatus Woesearchaeota archaeon]
MSSMFCTTCGSLLIPKTTPYGKWMSCPNNHHQPELNQTSIALTSKNNQQAQRIEVTDDKNHLAVHSHLCTKCGYNKAELIEISCSYSDEDNCYRMKCGHCKHIDILEGKLR